MAKKMEKSEFYIRMAVGSIEGGEQFKKLLEDIVAGLAGSSERRPEFKKLALSFSGDRIPDMLAGVPKTLGNPEAEWKKYSSVIDSVVVLPGQNPQWDEELSRVLKDPFLNICAIVRAERLFGKNGPDPEEHLILEEAIKATARKWLRKNSLGEEALCKAANWKASLEYGEGEAGYTSLFADPSARKMVAEVKEAILALKEKADGIGQLGHSAFFDPADDDHGSFFVKLAEESLKAPDSCRIPSILLLGESGTGKTLLARWIAGALFPEGESFARVNISAMQKDLIDAELFGAAKGAYTDRTSDTPGLFLSNAGKIVFLDEIGDMEPSCQTRLLTFLDDGLVRPLGWHGRPFEAPLIVVAATNRPVREWIAAGRESFREDLFYRFDYVISLPPLRERKKDMRLLISLCLQDEEVNPGYKDGGGVRRISLDAVEATERMDFPGNFRELRVRLKQACSAARREGTGVLCLRHLVLSRA